MRYSQLKNSARTSTLMRTKRLNAFLAILISIVLAGGASAGQQSTSSGPRSIADLRSAIDSVINSGAFISARWGIQVVSLDSGKVIYERDANKLFVPASNCKIFTAGSALDALGPDFRIRTSVYSNEPVDKHGVLKGDLIIYGRGDPTFAADSDQDPSAPLRPLADMIAKTGVKRITGDLVGDESYFRGGPFGTGWEWNDLQWYYGAEVSALAINDDALKLTVTPAETPGLPCRISVLPATPLMTFVNQTKTGPAGSARTIGVYRPVGENVLYVWGSLARDDAYSFFISIHNPALLFVTMLKDELARRGIVVNGRVKTADWKTRLSSPFDLSRAVELAHVDSAPLSEILNRTLKPSQNIIAQLLLLTSGAVAGAGANGPCSVSAGAGSTTTEELGKCALATFLDKAGVAHGDVILEEGAGLSRRDVATPQAFVKVLTYLARQKYFQTFSDALPVSGVDGTLKNRMKNGSAIGNMRAKTGSLKLDRSLSGYVTTAAGERLVFSIMLNNYANQSGNQPATAAIDRIAELLSSLAVRS